MKIKYNTTYYRTWNNEIEEWGTILELDKLTNVYICKLFDNKIYNFTRYEINKWIKNGLLVKQSKLLTKKITLYLLGALIGVLLALVIMHAYIVINWGIDAPFEDFINRPWSDVLYLINSFVK